MVIRTGPGRTALFMASLVSPGLLPNSFTAERWDPRVYVARDSGGRIVGVVQTALVNLAAPGCAAHFTSFSAADCLSTSYARSNCALSSCASHSG